MIYCQLQARFKLPTGQKLRLGDVAAITGVKGAEQLPLPCPDEKGVWKLTALHCAGTLQQAYPNEDVTMLGPDTCYVHRIHPARRDPTKWLRTLAAFIILVMGSALGLSWFHSDVDMPAAQMLVYRTLTGEAVQDPLLITVPYCIGVALGVAVFYALPSRKATTPLEVKLTTYQGDMEKTEGKDIPHGP